MNNLMVLIRFVFLGLLGFLSLLILTRIFSTWNIHATVAAGQHAYGPSVTLLFASCGIFIFIALAVSDRLHFGPTFSRVIRFECIWTAGLSVFMICSSVPLTVKHAVQECTVKANWAICASSSLLIPAAWSSTFITLFYCIFFISVVQAHASFVPCIWHQSIYAVPWFSCLESGEKIRTFNEKPQTLQRLDSDSSVPAFDSWTRYIDGLSHASGATNNSTITADVERAPWAKENGARRGVDHPFTVRPSLSSPPSRPSPEPISKPTPAVVEMKRKSLGTRFIERFYDHRAHSRETPFASFVLDDDKPIPQTDRSQWIRADERNFF